MGRVGCLREDLGDRDCLHLLRISGKLRKVIKLIEKKELQYS